MVHFCDQKHHVVVIGAGFGGLSVVRELEEPGVSITIIDRSNHHLFQPLLYQVAGASLWIGPYISIHFLSLNPLLVRRRRYSRGERYPSALCGCHSL